MDRPIFEYVGAVHVHTTYSDGSWTIPRIAEAASGAGLDFVLITDHMTLEGLSEEGWYGDTLILVGYEIHDQDRLNHYLAFNLREVLPPDLSSSQYVNKVSEGGGFGFMSHPDEKRSAHPDYPAYPWTNWDVRGFDGIEIWNYMSEWMESVNRWNVGLRILFPGGPIKGPTERTLEFWDSSNLDGKTVAIGGVDAHAMEKRRGPFKIVVFPYEYMFRTLMTHILLSKPLTGDLGKDRDMVYGALLRGNSFICNHLLADGSGFGFSVETADGWYTMGDSLQLSNPTELRVGLPRKGVITLIQNGEPILNRRGESLTYDVTQSGCYRIEVKIRKRSWILSNPIWVK